MDVYIHVSPSVYPYVRTSYVRIILILWGLSSTVLSISRAKTRLDSTDARRSMFRIIILSHSSEKLRFALLQQ